MRVGRRDGHPQRCTSRSATRPSSARRCCFRKTRTSNPAYYSCQVRIGKVAYVYGGADDRDQLWSYDELGLWKELQAISMTRAAAGLHDCHGREVREKYSRYLFKQSFDFLVIEVRVSLRRPRPGLSERPLVLRFTWSGLKHENPVELSLEN